MIKIILNGIKPAKEKTFSLYPTFRLLPKHHIQNPVDSQTLLSQAMLL